MMKKLIKTTLASLAGLLLLGGVAGAQEAKTITVIPKGTTHDFWKAVHAGALKAEKEMPGTKIIFQGPMREDDRNDQISKVTANISKGVSALVLAPLDGKALNNPVKQANRKKIPVVIIDSDIDRQGIEIVSFVATDNFKGGQLAGEELGRILGGKGNVVMLRYAVGSASTEAREKGFLDAIKKFPEIKVISDNQYAGATQETALQKATSLVGGLKEPFNGVFCPNESSTLGMMGALQSRGMAGKVKFVGFDASPKLLEGLKAGQINGLVVQNPFKMGYEGVKAAVAALNGEKVEPRIDTGCAVVTKENLNQPEIAELLNPPIEKK